jgi:hypothetical protein
MTTKSLVRRSVGGAVIVVTLFSLAYYGTYKQFDICTVCGQTHTKRTYYIPFTSIALFSHESLGQSPAGEIIAQGHMVDEHPHNWKTVYTIGNGQPLMMHEGKYANNVFNSSEVTNYLQVISGFQSKSAIAKYIKGAQQTVSAQEDGLASKATFLNESLLEPTTRKADVADALAPRR